MATLIRSTDVGAPVLTGIAGTLIQVLDYCLINTLSWTKTYSGTNKAVYQMPAGSNGHYLRVDDTLAQTFRIRGFETVSDVDTGTGPFPTDAQVSGGLWGKRSSASDTVARKWWLVGHGGFFHLVIDTHNNGGHLQGIRFGGLVNSPVADPYNTIIQGSSSSPAASQIHALGGDGSSANPLGSIGAVAGSYIARTFTQVGGSVSFSILPEGGVWTGSTKQACNSAASIDLPYPEPNTGALNLMRLRAYQAGSFRGRIPGLWAPAHNPGGMTGIASNDLITGSAGGDLSGRGFLALQDAAATNTAFIFNEITGDWTS